MNNIRDANRKIVRIHREIISLLTIVTEIMDKELESAEEQRDFYRMLGKFEICSNQLEILKDMLLVKVLSQETIED